jgi:hypothetical protein
VDDTSDSAFLDEAPEGDPDRPEGNAGGIDESLRSPTHHPLFVFIGVLLAVVGVALLLPPGLRTIAVVVALVAGAGFERYRQDHLPLPPSLSETPGAWWHKLRDEIGLAPALAALALIAAAIAVISFSTGGSDPRSGGSPPADAGGRAGPLPDLAIREEPARATFDAAGASFLVAPADGAAWAASLPTEPAAGRRRWLALAVEMSATRRKVDPAALSFRLTDGEGGLYYPDRQGTVGPSSLTRGGFLGPGESAEVRLAFLAPVDARDLALEFEPRPGGASKVRVSLP